MSSTLPNTSSRVLKVIHQPHLVIKFNIGKAGSNFVKFRKNMKENQKESSKIVKSGNNISRNDFNNNAF
jgi:hypothetical protein